MARTGKTGADAVAVALKHICRILVSYRTKLELVIAQAEIAGVIDATQKATALAFLASVDAACQIFILVAGYSGFSDS